MKGIQLKLIPAQLIDPILFLFLAVTTTEIRDKRDGLTGILIRACS